MYTKAALIFIKIQLYTEEYMKKLTLLVLCFWSFSLFCEPSSCVITDTGTYGVYVKSVPFWGFFRDYNKAIRLLVQKTKKTLEDIRTCIKLKAPVVITRDYAGAVKLQEEMLQVNCEVDIRELSFSFASQEEADIARDRLALDR